MTSKPKAIIFDMDGVLLDSEPLHDKVVDAIVASYGCELDAATRALFVGRSSMDMWTEIKRLCNLEASVTELFDAQWDNIKVALHTSGIPASEGLYEVLEKAQSEKLKIAIGSSSRKDFVREVLAYLDIERYIDYIVDTQKVEHGKPAPDMYLQAARGLGLEPSECMVVEDSTSGVASGKAAGMFVFGYMNPTSLGQDVSKADVVVTSLSQIIEHIN